MSYMLNTISSLKQVDRRAQPGALTLEVSTSYRFTIVYAWHSSAKHLADALIAVAKLDTDDVHAKDVNALITARVAVSHFLIGHFNHPYSLTVDISQAKEGARQFIESYGEKYKHRVSLPEGENAHLAAIR